MSAYVIGRGEDEAQIPVAAEFKKVSRRHAELSVIDSKSCRLVDLDSANGTEVLENGKWQRVKKAVVKLDDRVRLGGEYEASVRDLLRLAGQPGRRGQVAAEPPSGGGRPPPSPQQPDAWEGQGARAAPVGGMGTPVMASAPVSTMLCPACGSPVTGNYCGRCGARVPVAVRGIVGVLAHDMLGWRDDRGYTSVLVRLLFSPVSASVDLAKSPSFNLHGALFALSVAIYIGLVESLDTIAKHNAAQTGVSFPEIGTQSLFAELFLSPKILISIGIYVTFAFFFLITYYVFKDYSLRPASPRAYLKLSCISSLVHMVAVAFLFVPMFLLGLMWIELQTFQWMFALFLLLWMVFALQYTLRTTTRFWDISTVSAFRGIVVSSVLAIIAAFLLLFAIGLVIYVVKMATGSPM